MKRPLARPAPAISEAVTGPRDPEGLMVCDACRQRFRACMPPPIYHKHRLCHMCVGTVFPEMATAPIVGETEVHH